VVFVFVRPEQYLVSENEKTVYLWDRKSKIYGSCEFVGDIVDCFFCLFLLQEQKYTTITGNNSLKEVYFSDKTHP